MSIFWKFVTSPWGNNHGQPQSACWSPELGLFALCAMHISPGSANIGPVVGTSPDGVNWTGHFVASASASAWYDICWSPDLLLFVAVGVDATTGPDYFGTPPYTNTVWTSPDGVNWTPRGIPFGASLGGYGVCWSPDLGLFVITTVGFTATSPDGITWTATTAPAGFSSGGVCWAGPLSLFVATGPATVGSAWTSPDGVTWTAQTTPFDGAGGQSESILWSFEQGLVIIGGSDPTSTYAIMTSPDTITWTAQTTAPTAGISQGHPANAAGVALFPGFASPVILQSLDGTTWDAATNYESRCIAYSPELDVAVSGNGSANSGADEHIHGIYVSAPVPVTGDATDLGCAVATVAAEITPNTFNGGQVDWYFEWGTSTGYGNVTPGGSGIAGLDPLPVTDTIAAGFTVGVTYHYRVVAVHDGVAVYGSDATFVAVCAAAPALNAQFSL